VKNIAFTPTFIKTIFGLFAGALILALALDSSPRQGRRKAIDAAIKGGRIGRLSADRSAYLQNVLAAIAHELKLNLPVVLNATDHPDALHVYTTSPDSEALTGCGRGNAVYDATEDAIFIDESLVNPVDFVNLGEETQHSNTLTPDDITPLKTYLIFLLLHELGHRTLHRHARASFDVGRSIDRRRELEADQFAVSALAVSFRNQSGLTASILAKGSAYGVSTPEDTSVSDHAWLALVEMAHFISVSTMFSATPIAAIYQDAAHPSYLDRAQSIVEDALLDKNCSAKVREYFSLAREEIERARSIVNYRVVELVLPEPVYDMSFNARGLLVVPENSSHLYQLQSAELRPPVRREARTVAVSAATARVGSGFPELGPGNTASYGWGAVWSTPAAGTFELRPGQTFFSDSTFWRRAPPELEDSLSRYSIQHVTTPPSPSSIAIVQATTSEHANVLISLCDGVVCAERETNAILRESNLDAQFAFLNTLTDESTYLEIHGTTPTDALGRLEAVVVLDSRTLRTKRVIPLVSDVCSGGESEAAAVWDVLSFIVVPSGGTEHFICVASQHAKPDHWVAWEMSPGSPDSHVLLSEPLVAAVVHKNRSEFDDFELRNYLPSQYRAQWIGGSRVVLQLFNDSAWLLDVQTKQAAVLFHPGGEATRIAVGHDVLAVFYRGGYKCYLVDIQSSPALFAKAR